MRAIIAAAMAAAVGARQSFSPRVESLLTTLTTAEKIGQMTQLDVSLVAGAEGGIDTFLLDALADSSVGSFFNTPTATGGPCLNATRWVELVDAVQAAATTHGAKLPVIYGLDSVHGANYVAGSTIFPQSIGIAATFNRTAAHTMGSIGAKDTRAVGITWSFAPILGLMSQPSWPRCYETLGEDPFLASELAREIICGAQGCPTVLNDPTKVAATMKHFIGYSDPRSGHDRTPAWIPWRHLLQYYRPAFQAAVDAGVATAMESYSEVNGVPMAASHQHLSVLLRDMMGFRGVLVTDYAEIENLHSWHRVAASAQEAVTMAINRTSIDMSMVPLDMSFNSDLQLAVQQGAVSLDRIDESAGRVLALKEALGLLDQWKDGKRVETPEQAATRMAVLASVGSAADRNQALEVARQAVVLLANPDNVLPLTVPAAAQLGAGDLPDRSVRGAKSGAAPFRLLVVGPSADSISNQCGGWTIHWQGAVSDAEYWYGTTVLGGLRNVTATYGLALEVTYEPGCSIDGTVNATSLVRIAQLAPAADAVVYVGGEGPYAEKPGNIDDLSLAPGQGQVIATLQKLLAGAGRGTPFAVVLFAGRPRLLPPTLLTAYPTALLHGLLTGPDAGQVIAEVLVGATVPSGRLPYSHPQDPANALVHYWHTNPEADSYDPLFPFAAGLSYAPFAYADLACNLTASAVTHAGTTVPSVSIAELRAAPVQVTVTVTNTGAVHTAATSVLVYLTDEYRSVTPEVKMLKGFDRTPLLAPGASHTATVLLTADAFSYWNESEPPQYVIEPGTFVLSVQDSDLTLQFLVTA